MFRYLLAAAAAFFIGHAQSPLSAADYKIVAQGTITSGFDHAVFGNPSSDMAGRNIKIVSIITGVEGFVPTDRQQTGSSGFVYGNQLGSAQTTVSVDRGHLYIGSEQVFGLFFQQYPTYINISFSTIGQPVEYGFPYVGYNLSFERGQRDLRGNFSVNGGPQAVGAGSLYVEGSFTDGPIQDVAELQFEINQFSYAVGSFATVPEPSAWAMLILGFGMIGAAARSRVRKGWQAHGYLCPTNSPMTVLPRLS